MIVGIWLVMPILAEPSRDTWVKLASTFPARSISPDASFSYARLEKCKDYQPPRMNVANAIPHLPNQFFRTWSETTFTLYQGVVDYFMKDFEDELGQLSRREVDDVYRQRFGELNAEYVMTKDGPSVQLICDLNLAKSRFRELLERVLYYHHVMLVSVPSRMTLDVREWVQDRLPTSYNWLREILCSPKKGFPLFGRTAKEFVPDPQYSETQRILLDYLTSLDISSDPSARLDYTAIHIIFDAIDHQASKWWGLMLDAVYFHDVGVGLP